MSTGSHGCTINSKEQSPSWEANRYYCYYYYYYGVVSYKVSHALRLFVIYCASPSELYSFQIHPPELWQLPRHLIAKQEKLGEEWP
jgi:hypothetical protein